MADLLIDGRPMLPPEPLIRTLTAIDLLTCHDELTLIVSQRPYPLLRVLANSGFNWTESEESTGGWRYRIFRNC
jgi:uncharacterized protein (DUF2249 family)